MSESWFSHLFGAAELCSPEAPTKEGYEATQQLFKLEVQADGGSDVLIAPNGRRFLPGRFETLSLLDLRKLLAEHEPLCSTARLEVRNVISDVRTCLVQPEAAGSVFQVASQFNCLEFVHRGVTPEFGISCYQFDKTQGPACALSCAASTVWRNYFLSPGADAQLGQQAHRQLNCLEGVQAILGKDLLEVTNGYSSSHSIDTLDAVVRAMSEPERDSLRAALRIGIQWNAEVTAPRIEYKKNVQSGRWENVEIQCDPVTQVFCSALSVPFAEKSAWAAVSQVILEAAYEATLSVAALNARRGGKPDVYLTLLGGGAFGNEPAWIEAAIRRALTLFKNEPLRVSIVHFNDRAPWIEGYQRLVQEWNARVNMT